MQAQNKKGKGAHHLLDLVVGNLSHFAHYIHAFIEEEKIFYHH